MENAKIVVIGAGPSGISAATKLLELGFQKVTLIEAEDRIGGRVNTIPFGDNVVELGAQWCHGEKDNVVFELASKANLLEHSKEDFLKFSMVRSNKEVVPPKIAERLKAIYDSIMEAGETDLLTFKGSVGKYLTKEFFEALKKPENADIDMTIAREVFDNFDKMENSLNASDSLEELSAKGFLEYWDCDGDLYLNWKDKGYVRFLRLLMNATDTNKLGVLDGKIKLGKQVEKISWTDEGSQPIQIKSKDGEVIEADHVIVTVSLGVLKEKHFKLFDPQLPAQKIQAIETIGFGTIDKIYLEFASPFWPSDWTGFSILWREEELKKLRGSNQFWLEDISGFFPVANQPRVLCGWMSKPNARYMESLPDKEVLESSLCLLRKFLNWEIPSPVNFKRTTWFSNENFKGSYSFQSIKAEEVNAKPSDLASPLTNSVKKPVVLFAGEATSDHYFGSVQGAVTTGWREAKRLAEFYNNSGKLE